MDNSDTFPFATKPVAQRDTAEGASAQNSAASVLQQVAHRSKTRRRRHGRAPGWATWVSRKARLTRTFFSHTLPVWLRSHRDEVVSYAVSGLVIGLACLLMALWALPPGSANDFFGLVVSAVEDVPETLDATELEEIVQPEVLRESDLNGNMKQLLSDLDDGETSSEMDSIEERDLTLDLEPTDADLEAVFKKGEFGGRSKAGRRAALKRFGGTADSERAVTLGLQWLKRIQRDDGSWSFADQGPEATPGSLQRTEVGATSLALLCFLGAGHTHAVDGPYRETVQKALAFIGASASIQQGMADLRGDFEGNSGMYVQGLATICLSEAHALDPGNEDLRKLTEMAVAFIERVQGSDGGWRYRPPRDAGDTSVVGWQVMALQSARAGRISVSSSGLRDVKLFLKSVQVDKQGGLYAYMAGNNLREKPSMTAVALLCRMYLGWKQEHEGLKKGVQHLSVIGPSRNDIYYNYYATQVMHHWGGDLWEKWNNELRDHLVRTQITDGPAAGSWAPTAPHHEGPGQIYQTTLSILTLEVYYRHLPLYQKLEQAADDPDQVRRE
ncbi:MAG: prenyltransferase/squalene oxidase repeat-containing protein [Planctomycetaceae bacterium]